MDRGEIIVPPFSYGTTREVWLGLNDAFQKEKTPERYVAHINFGSVREMSTTATRSVCRFEGAQQG